MTLIIIQARMDSYRLQGKVMKPLDGFPVLQHVITRCRNTGFPFIVATPDTEDNKPIWELCERMGIGHFKGHPTDLTKRYKDCVDSRAMDVDVIIRITADCPLINTELIVLTERLFRLSGAKGYMEFDGLHGLNVEVFDRETLSQAVEQGPDEHCTQWMRKTHKIPFPSLELNTQEDYERLQSIYNKKQ